MKESPWIRHSLGNLCDFEMGQAPPGEECNKNGVGTPFVKAGEFGASTPILREWTTKPLKHARRGDVLICVVGATAGKLNLGVDCAIGRSVAAIRPRAMPLLNTRFLYYQLLPRVESLRAASQGSAQGVISKAMLSEIPIGVPDSTVQNAIVESLDSYFTRIDATTATLERVMRGLKRYRSSILEAASTGRLVPAEAELARAERRSFESASEFLARILAERRARWGTSPNQRKYVEPMAPETRELPTLPEGWCWATAEQLSWDSGYGTSQKCTPADTGAAVLRIPNVRGGRITLGDLKYATSPSELPLDGKVVDGDMLIVRTNGSSDLIGRSAVVQDLPRACYFASYLIRFRMLGNRTLQQWVGRVWNASTVRAQILADAASSAGQFNVNLRSLSRVVLPLPPLAEQARLLATLEHHASITEAAEATVLAEQVRLRSLRRAVLHTTFRGERTAT